MKPGPPQRLPSRMSAKAPHKRLRPRGPIEQTGASTRDCKKEDAFSYPAHGPTLMDQSVKSEWDCFLAYPAPQRALAERLFEHVAGRVRIFFDRRDVKPGDDWPIAIARALDACPVTAIIVGPESPRSFYEQEEISRAVGRARDPEANRRVIPVYVDGMTPDDVRVPYGLRAKQGYVVACG